MFWFLISIKSMKTLVNAFRAFFIVWKRRFSKKKCLFHQKKGKCTGGGHFSKLFLEKTI